jgi:hypothetical protein
MIEWIDVEKELPAGRGDIVRAKNKNGEVKKVYYHQDSMSWLILYGKKTSKFQDMQGNFLFDITHWRPLKND